MLNENVLIGVKCPSCGSCGPFHIVVRCFAEVHDGGIEDTWDHEWDDGTPCHCVMCSFDGAVSDFKSTGEQNGEVYSVQ